MSEQSKPSEGAMNYALARIEALEVLMVDLAAERMAKASEHETGVWSKLIEARAEVWGAPSYVIAEDVDLAQAQTKARVRCIQELLAGIRVRASEFRKDRRGGVQSL